MVPTIGFCAPGPLRTFNTGTLAFMLPIGLMVGLLVAGDGAAVTATGAADVAGVVFEPLTLLGKPGKLT